jgi:hypothetical protein
MSESKTINEASDEEPIFSGMIFATNDEFGPNLRINASPLAEREALAVAIQGITAVSFGKSQIHGLFGPLPVPYNEAYLTIVYVFNVKAQKSLDPTIIKHGKFCALFMVFEKEKIPFIAHVYHMIESLFNVYQENYLQREQDLKEGSLQMIYDEVVTHLKFQKPLRLFRIENGLTTEFGEQAVIVGKALSALISEKEGVIYSYQPRNLPKKRKKVNLEALKRLNQTDYQGTLKIKKISTKKKFNNLLERNNLKSLKPA